ncbi:two-component system regulatory protein YycI [Bacillus sp. FJAT-49736]|uniref:two-component system regulatory protein YycI n=1 Tax=Bacillus sp. FJAT-49736 TaxID=2833582 RepID=UPI001BC9E384|nr:two-component system regulatory protein YycI [Bacillus sp. FJAT-49736]MBS4175218.1 two-component system regulatory protein YycI [Bacillus sp. FJAT-49736]
MEWSKTKTMFIIVFLILDLFLATQLFNKYSKSQYDVIQNASDEDRLKADEITYDRLPTDKIRSQYLRAKSKIFTSKDIKRLVNQSALITKDGTDITSYFNKPIAISGKIDKTSIDKVLKDKNILYNDQYTFWKYDKDMKQINYIQTYKDMPIFKNISGHIIFYLNDKNEIVSYEQTLLNIEDEVKEGDVWAAIKAIDTLHNKGMLKRKSKILEPELGYYTRIQSSELQLLVPTWYFAVVNDGKTEDFFVDAFEGQVFEMNDNGNLDDPNSNDGTQLKEKPNIKGDLKAKQNEPGDY